ncbi:uncharacterized protein LOC134265891 [Saccostrea cucullata]|uniref:uncharacterized protein LOC134265891 n=1 Tax=Saccostrea cuccullata TaxID=36930 RepID=UPI002ED434C8
MIKFLLTAWIMSIIFGPNILCSLQDRDPKCRYTVHQPGASWHTAYNVCASSNGTLPQITSLSEMYFLDLVLEEVDNLLETHSGLRISAGLWIGAFLRSSNNESMLENCDHLDSQVPVNITAVSPGDMFCLYYNRFEKTLFTENCSTAKIFICETNDEDLGECMIKSSLSTLRNQTQKQFCEDDKYDEKPISLTLCEANCLKKANCYTFTYENEVCILYKYMDNPSCARRDPLQIRKYKVIALSYRLQ